MGLQKKEGKKEKNAKQEKQKSQKPERKKGNPNWQPTSSFPSLFFHPSSFLASIFFPFLPFVLLLPYFFVVISVSPVIAPRSPRPLPTMSASLMGATLSQLLAMSPDLTHCAVCQKDFAAPCLLDCLHSMCLAHLAPANGRVQCPICRSRRENKRKKEKKNKRGERGERASKARSNRPMTFPFFFLFSFPLAGTRRWCWASRRRTSC